MDFWGYLFIGIAAISAIIVAIIDCYKNWKSLKELFKDIRNGFIRAISFNKTRARRKFNKKLSSIEYVEWQKKQLLDIYRPIIKKYKDKAQHCDIAKLFDYEYDAVWFKSVAIDYPFSQIKERSKLGNFELCVTNKNGVKRIKHAKQAKISKHYYRLLKPTIKFPNNIGYMLDELNFSQNGFSFSAYPSTYYMNVCQSNVLEYELYKEYKPNKKGIPDVKLKDLSMRSKIHECFRADESEILINGKGRASLLGVQAMVFCKNRYESYDVLRIQRSENVDDKVNFYQFIPSGGFSALESGFSHDTVISNFSLSKAILRELLEECFGEEDFSGRKNISPENIYANEVLKKLDLINGKTLVQFIGSTLNLVNLRHELCFLIVIDDFDIVDRIRNNEECSNVIQFISAKKLASKEYWEYEYSKEKVDDKHLRQVADYKMLNPTSAALWNLVQQTNFYKGLNL